MEAGEADGALVAGVCDYWRLVSGGTVSREREGESLRKRGSELAAYLRLPMKMESAQPVVSTELSGGDRCMAYCRRRPAGSVWWTESIEHSSR